MTVTVRPRRPPLLRWPDAGCLRLRERPDAAVPVGWEARPATAEAGRSREAAMAAVDYPREPFPSAAAARFDIHRAASREPASWPGRPRAEPLPVANRCARSIPRSPESASEHIGPGGPRRARECR